MKGFIKKFIKKVIMVGFCFCVFSCSSERYSDGVYTGVSEGHMGDIKVEVIIVKNKISEINILEYSDTPGFSDEVFERLPQTIINKNSADVDVISGATNTSRGVLEAVKNALEKSKR
ncbi:MAG: FMN-binding protein [Treponemataceae bacterium]